MNFELEIKNQSNNNQLILIGRKSVIDAIHDSILSKKICRIFLTASQVNLIKICNNLNLSYKIVSKKWFEKKFSKQNHQNCCIYILAKKQINISQLLVKTKTQKKSIILMLDQIQDPHNFGAILRTAVAANVSAIIIPKHNQVKLNTTVLKVSAGSGLLIDIIEVTNLNVALEKLKQNGYWSYASLINDQSQDYDTIDYAQKSVLIVGNEGDGISNLLASKADFKIQIPTTKKVDSLNVAVATGILIYQMLK